MRKTALAVCHVSIHLIQSPAVRPPPGREWLEQRGDVIERSSREVLICLMVCVVLQLQGDLSGRNVPGDKGLCSRFLNGREEYHDLEGSGRGENDLRGSGRGEEYLGGSGREERIMEGSRGEMRKTEAA